MPGFRTSRLRSSCPASISTCSKPSLRSETRRRALGVVREEFPGRLLRIAWAVPGIGGRPRGGGKAPGTFGHQVRPGRRRTHQGIACRTCDAQEPGQRGSSWTPCRGRRFLRVIASFDAALVPLAAELPGTMPSKVLRDVGMWGSIDCQHRVRSGTAGGGPRRRTNLSAQGWGGPRRRRCELGRKPGRVRPNAAGRESTGDAIRCPAGRATRRSDFRSRLPRRRLAWFVTPRAAPLAKANQVLAGARGTRPSSGLERASKYAAVGASRVAGRSGRRPAAA